MKLLMIGKEVLTAFCSKCSCCLAGGTHCWHCHVTKPIEKLCHCGTCMERLQDYKEREEIRVKAVALRASSKGRRSVS